MIKILYEYEEKKIEGEYIQESKKLIKMNF